MQLRLLLLVFPVPLRHHLRLYGLQLVLRVPEAVVGFGVPRTLDVFPATGTTDKRLLDGELVDRAIWVSFGLADYCFHDIPPILRTIHKYLYQLILKELLTRC